MSTDIAVATVIGDVIDSRGAADRADLHRRLARALAEVNEGAAVVTPLRVTVGDEYQGSFARVGDALRATFRLRLSMLPDADVRHGVGWGAVTVLSEEPRVEDGPGWWAARDAIHAVQAAERRPGTRHRRTAYRRAPAAVGVPVAAVEAALLLRDQQVGALDERSVSVVRGLLAGHSQREIARELGITASAVSQRVRSDGLAALVESDTRLGEVT